MARAGFREYRIGVVVALLLAGALTLIGSGPASADVSAVKGSACGYIADVSLFGGPKMLRGCGQASDADAGGASPSVALAGGRLGVADLGHGLRRGRRPVRPGQALQRPVPRRPQRRRAAVGADHREHPGHHRAVRLRHQLGVHQPAPRCRARPDLGRRACRVRAWPRRRARRVDGRHQRRDRHDHHRRRKRRRRRCRSRPTRRRTPRSPAPSTTSATASRSPTTSRSPTPTAPSPSTAPTCASSARPPWAT